MKYALLIYGEESMSPAEGSPESQAMIEDYGRYTESINRLGINKGGDALFPTTTATSVRVRDGETLATDGPFAETKEQLGGFYIVECDDLDAAIEAAAACPGAAHGTVEVRPVLDFG